MRAQLRAELLKHRSTRTNLGLLATLLGLVLLAVLLHGLALPAGELVGAEDQLSIVVGWGAKLGVLFAGLLGAMSMTSEFRHGTIRPTFLVTPQRSRVVFAKALAGTSYGSAFGLLATAVALGAGRIALGARGIESRLDLHDQILFVAGGAVGAALWAAVGAGVGALVRNQVPALVGLCAWLLLVEGLLLGDLFPAIGTVTRFAPGAAAAAMSGLEADELLAPVGGFGVLVLYALVGTGLGAVATARRDVG